MKVFAAFLSFLLLSSYKTNAQNDDVFLNNQKTNRQKADTCFSLAMQHFSRSNFDSAGFYLNKGAVFAEQTGDNETIIKYYLSLGNTFTLNNEADQGLIWLRKANAYITNSTSYEQRQKHVLFQGMAFARMQNTDSALLYYHQCELLNNELRPYNNWQVYNLAAKAMENADMNEESEKYFMKAHQLVKAAGNRIDYGIVLYNLSNFYYQWNKPEKFAAILDERQKFVQSGKKDYSRDPEHRMLFIDWAKEPFDKKITFMQSVKKAFLKNGAVSNAALSNFYLAGFYEENNQEEEALRFIRENDRSAYLGRDIINLYTNTKMLYRLLKKTGKTAEAMAAADRLFTLKDSLIRLQQRETLIEAEIRYDTEKKEKDIALLNYENQVKSLMLGKQKDLLIKETDLRAALQRENKLKDSVVQNEKQYNQLLESENKMREKELRSEQALKMAATKENKIKEEQLVKEKRARAQLIAGSLLLLACGLVIFLLYRKQRIKNRIIQKQSDDLHTLMKEIHHRVKNNLQVISSLLDLQSLSIKDKQAADAVREGKIRVQSMALIHQNLYNADNIRGIFMDDYVNTLAGNLFASYNIQKGKVRIITDVDHINLDVDTVIPIGLIINELISNSLKYAFGAEENGVIHVALKDKNNVLELIVKDTGRGFPPNWNRAQPHSFGYNLINAFAQKLKAKMDIYNDSGACVLMNISRFKLA